MCCKQIFQPKNFPNIHYFPHLFKTHPSGMVKWQSLSRWNILFHLPVDFYANLLFTLFYFSKIFILTDNANSDSFLLLLLQCFLVMLKLELFCQVPVKILVEKWYIFCDVYELIWENLKFLHYSILLIVSNWLKCSFHFFRTYIYWVPTMRLILL